MHRTHVHQYSSQEVGQFPVQISQEKRYNFSDKIPYCTSIREANAAIAIGRAAQRGLQTRDIKGCGKPCIASHYRFSEYTYSINPEFDEGILYLPSNYNYKYAPDHINSGFLYLSR